MSVTAGRGHLNTDLTQFLKERRNLHLEETNKRLLGRVGSINVTRASHVEPLRTPITFDAALNMIQAAQGIGGAYTFPELSLFFARELCKTSSRPPASNFARVNAPLTPE